MKISPCSRVKVSKSGRYRFSSPLCLTLTETCVFCAQASQCFDPHFEVTTQSPSIKEGSCIELNLTSTRKLPNLLTNWIWMKDAHGSGPRKNFKGTVILSSDTKVRPVHPDFVGRAKSQDSLPSQWPMVLMCNATKSDSGKYSFVYKLTEGERSLWAGASAVVTVEGKWSKWHT